MPDSALQNSKNVFVRFCCFCFPYKKRVGLECLDSVERAHTREDQGQGCRYNSATRHGT